MPHGIPPEWSSADYDEQDDSNFERSPFFSDEAVERARELLASEPYEPQGEAAELAAKMRYGR
ncbi:MAG TPA: hypothetical protein VFM12_06375 [Gemmatimonadales bacterium]|nr:hypothetical protein [Gemmatimonadales bacterium]